MSISNNLLLNLYKYYLKRPLLLAKTAINIDVATFFFGIMFTSICFGGSIACLNTKNNIGTGFFVLLNLATVLFMFLIVIHSPLNNKQKCFEESLKKVYENSNYFNLNINNLIEFLTELKLINSQEEVKKLFNSLNEEIINKDREEKEIYLAGLFFIEETLNKYFEEHNELQEKINEIKVKQEKLIRQLNFKLAVERANSIKNS